jgi:Outer membrane protein beta-barrel domain
MTTKTTRVLALFSALMLVPFFDAQAQAPEPPTFFAGVNVGFQLQADTITSTNSFTVYAETAAVTATQEVNPGVMIDISAGYRFSRNLGVAIAVSRFSDSSDAEMTAIVPHPLFFNQPRTVTATSEGLDRTELGVHLQAVWFVTVPDALPDEVRIAITGGPTIFSLDQQLIATAAVPAQTQNAVPVVESQSETAVGFNIGVDVTYPLTPRFGVGGFARYAGGSVDLPAAQDAGVGGFQLGVGARVGF